MIIFSIYGSIDDRKLNFSKGLIGDVVSDPLKTPCPSF